MITRREFGKRTSLGLLGLAAGGMLLTEGCNFVSDILTWAPVGLAAFNGIVTMLETFGIISAANPALGIIVMAVRTGFSDLVQDVQLYESIQPPPQGALAEIQAVLTLIAQNIKDLFSQIVTNFSPVINLIIGLSQLILGTIAAFLNKLGGPTTVSPNGKKISLAAFYRFEVAGQTVTYVPQSMSLGTFKQDYNKICASQGHYEMYLR